MDDILIFSMTLEAASRTFSRVLNSSEKIRMFVHVDHDHPFSFQIMEDVDP